MQHKMALVYVESFTIKVYIFVEIIFIVGGGGGGWDEARLRRTPKVLARPFVHQHIPHYISYLIVNIHT